MKGNRLMDYDTLNDRLTAIAIEAGVDVGFPGAEDTLDNLTHHVAATLGLTALPDPSRPAPGSRHHSPTTVDTEVVSADLIAPRSGTLRALALDAIGDAGRDGLTDGELAHVTGAYLYTIAPRRGELLRSGWVKDSGARRISEHGRPVVVWVLTPAGRARLQG